MHCPQLNITVNGTSKCTMSCRYCNAHKTLNRPDITFIQLCDGIKMIEDEFESIGSKRLHFNSQDSSLIYKTVVDPAIKKFNGDYKISFHSNGILLNDNNLQQFVENNIRLMISLDGPKHVQDINRLNR